MTDFWDGFKFGAAFVGFLICVVAPMILGCFNAWFVLLYIVTIPIAIGLGSAME